MLASDPDVPAADLMKWEQQSVKWRSELQISQSFRPWTSRRTFSGLGLSRTKRSLDLLDCSWVEACKRRKISVQTHSSSFMKEALAQQVHHGLVVDVSQNPVRKPMSDKQGVLRTLTTSSTLYSFEHDRVLHPIEHMFLQGYPKDVSVPHTLSVQDLRKLAGEAICLPCLASIVWSIHLMRDLTSL